MNTLYRFYDHTDTLLYVGLTINPGRRMEKHRGKPWWTDVATVTMEQHVDHAALRVAERTAIETEKPLYNIQLNKGSISAIPALPAEPSLACNLKLNEVYALGLDNGDCPVGLIVEGDEDGVVLVLYDWLVGMFYGDDLWVAAGSIERWKRAERIGDQQKRPEGYADTQTVFGMDPLGTFQTHWGERHKLVSALHAQLKRDALQT